MEKYVNTTFVSGYLEAQVDRSWQNPLKDVSDEIAFHFLIYFIFSRLQSKIKSSASEATK